VNVLFLWRCSFCGRTSSQVNFIVAIGQPNEPAICDDCIKTAQEVVDLKIKQDESEK
jgi:ATP-dependent protease Clp ATPase subunit